MRFLSLILFSGLLVPESPTPAMNPDKVALSDESLPAAATADLAPQTVGIASTACEATSASEPEDERLCGPRPPLPGVLPGQRVRVRSPIAADPLIGTVIEYDDHILRLDLGEREKPLTIPRNSIERLEISRESHKLTERGAMIGGILVGLPLGLLGMACGAVANIECRSHCHGDLVWTGGAAGAAIGVGLGALIGSATMHNRWERVPSSQIRVQIAPRRHGFGASLAFKF
ncbi:MAG: hypothetical protein MUF51_07795 [Vicinamibacteria bacterium]|nr:hypothetical protein [Vicinamibacteria bacterium]